MVLYYIYFYDDIDNPYICSSIKSVIYILEHNYRSIMFHRKLVYGLDYYIERLCI